MKLICTQENLQKALSYLERIVGKQTTLPILSNILLETENGRLKLSATNLEIGVIAYIGAKIEKEGKIAIPAKLLGNFISNLPLGDVVSLIMNGQALELISGGYTMKIKGLDGKDFPIIPQYRDEYIFSLPPQVLKAALSRILFSASINEARMELTGAHFFFFENEIHIAATDSFRLAEEILPMKMGSPGYADFSRENPSLIIPIQTLFEILRVITPESDMVHIALKENQIFFEVDGVQIVSRLINGKYPDYKQIVPEKYTYTALVPRADLIRAVKIANTFSSYNAGEVTLKLDQKEGKIIIDASSQEVGENHAEISAEINGIGSLALCFNSRYLTESLNVLSSEKVVLLANSATTPIAIRPILENNAPDTKYFSLVMPIRK